MKIARFVQKNIEERLFKGKIIILYGARQVGKTTLVRSLLEKYPGLYVNGELLPTKELFNGPDPERIKQALGQNKLVVIDEAQTIPQIGLILKTMIDTFPEIQIIATGSSSFELADRLSEPLTGRAWHFFLYPISWAELAAAQGTFASQARLERVLRFGLYPEVVVADEPEAIRQLNEITASYLYKDVLLFEGIKKSGLIIKLLQLLAFQIGSEVSLSELARALGISRLTVEKYLDVLEKAFVISILHSFSRNPRSEILKGFKVYFYDLGVRNSLIQNFNPLSVRNDVGALWENWLIIEKIKADAYAERQANRYFWRTYDQQEIDYIEDYGGQLHAYEFKWSEDKKKVPPAFNRAYPDARFEVVNQTTYEGFLAPK